MACIELAPEVLDDFDRIFEHLAGLSSGIAAAQIAAITHSLAVLEFSPLLGRPVARGQRELVIGRKGHGYVALYRYVERIDTVFVLAVRSQREAGYS